MTRALVVFLLAIFLVAPAQADPGSLLLIGGGDHPPAVMKKFIALAGGPQALFVVVPTASSLASTGPAYVRELKGYGCKRVRVLRLRSRRDATHGDWEKLLPQAGGVFFTGGDQVRLMNVCRDTPFEKALKKAHARGAAIAGTSAGTACMSGPMMTGDADLTVIRDDPRALVKGFGLFPGVILDQHFVKRQRFNRLISAVAAHPNLVGIGVDEATAVWWRPDGAVEVLGSNCVALVDARAATVRKNGRRFAVKGMTVQILLPGDVWKP
ncbi:MAG: cyanophycinase [Armatimonadetes bacterium]|nr:cyanophycinase [Armatimonadota bacterium]